jgi:hypothetical protein
MKFTANEIKLLLVSSYEKKSYYDIGKFKIDRSLSDTRVRVFTVDDSDDVIVVHRGSASLKDWVDNAIWLRWNILEKSATFKMHLRKHKKAIKEYGADNIIVMGHSRGGLYATMLYNKKLAKQLVTYNKPINMYDIAKDLFTKKKQDKSSTVIKTSNDLVSVGQKFMKKNENDVIIPSETLNPLAEHGMDKLDDHDEEELIGKGVSKKGKPRVISVKTYRSFMKKYKLKLMKKVNGAYKYKSMKEMSAEILKYETDHEDIKVGLYYEEN